MKNCTHKTLAVKTYKSKVMICQDCGHHFGSVKKFNAKDLPEFVEPGKVPKERPEPKPFTPERIAEWTMFYGEHDGKLLKDIPEDYLRGVLAYTDPIWNIHRAISYFLDGG